MRIEMKATGLMGMMNVAFYQMQFNSFSNLSDEVKENFERVSNSLYSLNGGVGTLQNAATLIQQRITQENQKRDNIQSARNETNNFLKETVATDRRIANIVSQNNEQFYQINPYLKPMHSTIITLNVDILGLLRENLLMVNAVKKCSDMIVEYKSQIIIEDFERKGDIPNHGIFEDDNFGYYGGNQGAAKNLSRAEKKELCKIIKKNNPKLELSDAQLDAYLKKMNSEGCGYTALINTIMYYYQDKPEEFYQKFGYPLRDENGQLNYNMLLVDFYSYSDNKHWYGYNTWQDYNWSEDGAFWKYDYRNDTTGSGLVTNGAGLSYLKKFLKAHDIKNVKTKSSVNITTENYPKMAAEGKQIILSYHNGWIYDENGNQVQKITGGHAMYITGVTDDGRFIVSSWGRKMYIYPDDPNSDNERYTFSTVEYY